MRLDRVMKLKLRKIKNSNRMRGIRPSLLNKILRLKQSKSKMLMNQRFRNWKRRVLMSLKLSKKNTTKRWMGTNL